LMNNNSTCLDWTTSDGSPDNGTPRCGMSWPRERNGRGNHWISEFSAPGCAAGVGTEGRPPPGSDTVGAGGGYGGFYCFGLHP